jgi:dTDP-4-amino-4,6-dideoxygalactose transaminase
MNPAVTEIVNPTLLSGFISQGARVEEFETKLRNLFDHNYLVTLNSATSGLTLALRMIKDKYNLQDTDEVLSSPLTCMATNEPILANNLRIKWVDIDPKTCNIDLNDLNNKISKKTRVLLFVHWGGNPLDMDKLSQILDQKESEYGFRVQVIEDCAHAMLAEWNGKKLGTTGNYAVYSLQAIKHLTTGDGGILLLPTEEDMEQAKLLRWFGIDREKRNFKGKDFRLEGDVERWGYKFHMNDINASIGLANIQSVNDIVKKHRENSLYYDNHLQNLTGIHLLEKSEKGSTASWIYTLLVDRLEEFIEYMKDKKITVSSVHKRNDVHTCFKQFQTDLPQLNKLESKYVCIPVGWWLTTEEREYIVKSIYDYSKIE